MKLSVFDSSCHSTANAHMPLIKLDNNFVLMQFGFAPTRKSILALQDPVALCPAVLVKKYDITQQKELELQLARQQEALQT